MQTKLGAAQSRRTSAKFRRKILARYLGLILLTLMMACSLTINLAPEQATPTETLPAWPCSPSTKDFPLQFHVEGNAFVDQNNNPTMFRGMAAIDPIYQRFDSSTNHTQWNEQYYRVMGQWCANIIRLPILPSSLRNYGMEKTLETLDQTIAWAAKYKLYVIIDFHALGWPPENFYPPDAPWYSSTQMEVMSFWETISSRYAHNNTVAFYELYNEPVTPASYKDYSGASATLQDWQIWKKFIEPIMVVIRANDPDKIVLVGGLQFAYDLSFVADDPITGKNVAFATHPYSHPTWKKDWDAAFGDLSAQYPIFATEFGYDQGSSPDDNMNGTPYHEAIINYLEEHHISWTVWVFDGTWAPPLLMDNFTYQPSPAGEYFRGIMHDLNSPK